MSSSPASIIQLPLTRPVFNYNNEPNSFNTTIQVLGSGGQTSSLHTCLIDTGSCGIVIPQQLLYVDGVLEKGLIPGVQQGDPVTVLYQPSSEDLRGYYYTIPQLAVGGSLSGAPAFVAQNVVVAGVYNASNPGMGMMGVGFGRPHSYGTNVLLSAPGVYPSYLFTQQGITLGYTAATLPSASSYGMQALVKALASPTPDWQTPAANISINSTSFAGNALLDTGINSMILSAAYGSSWPADLIGATVQISWPHTTVAYSFSITGSVSAASAGQPPFAVSGSSAMMPTEVNTATPAGTAFVNTGIHVLLGANYFYDSQLGQVGLMPTPGS